MYTVVHCYAVFVGRKVPGEHYQVPITGELQIYNYKYVAIRLVNYICEDNVLQEEFCDFYDNLQIL